MQEIVQLYIFIICEMSQSIRSLTYNFAMQEIVQLTCITC